MATMNATRTLSDSPFGASLGVKAMFGKKVIILDDTTNPFWLKIQLVQGDGPGPIGWVNAQSVNRDDVPSSALDKTNFASECVFQAMTYRVMAHYLMAIAQMRTDITDGEHGNDYGPFALSKDEWATFALGPALGLGMSEDMYQDWIAQCLVFAAMANATQTRLSALLANEPTAAELALAQMIGPSAAFQVLRDPGKPVRDVVTSLGFQDIELTGMNADTLGQRYADYVAGKTGQQALDLISQRLQSALDETAKLITDAGAQFIEFADELASADSPGPEFVSADIIGTRTVRYTAKDGSTLVRRDGSLAWRQNNPGNISNGKFADAHGAIGKGDRFAIFASEQAGFAAIIDLLKQPEYSALSLQDAIARYAPPSENDTAAYVAALSAQTGIARTTILNTLTDAQLKALAGGIQTHEGWKAGSETRTASPTQQAAAITADRLVGAALQEWDHWGRSTHNLITKALHIGKTEKDATYAEYVYDTYYRATVDNPDTANRPKMLARIREEAKPTYAWSACAMSFFMKAAGYTKEQFRFSESHSVYIRDAVAARKEARSSACFWGYRLDEVAPAVGDLIGYGRADGLDIAAAQAWYDRTGRYDSHTDLVVAVRPGEIDVIGGNVSDSVTRKTLATDAKGKLADRTFPWFVILKRRLPNA